MALIKDSRFYYYHNTPNGTPEKLTNEQQQVVWQANQDAFGAPLQPNTFVQPLRAPGQYHDIETGLYYNHHRYHDPNTGRYLQADPIGLRGGANLYAYVGKNDP